MGCAPSKNTSNVHPTGLSNDSIVPPEQGECDPSGKLAVDCSYV